MNPDYSFLEDVKLTLLSIPAAAIGLVRNVASAFQAATYKVATDIKVAIFVATPIVANVVDQTEVYLLGAAAIVAEAAAGLQRNHEAVIPKRR